MITEDYVSFETAKLLKEKGFDEETHGYYPIKGDATGRLFANSSSEYNHNHSQVQISAPTLQMTMKWLREVHNITIGITFSYGLISYEIQKNEEFITSIGSGRTYEQMVEEAIQLCVKTLI